MGEISCGKLCTTQLLMKLSGAKILFSFPCIKVSFSCIKFSCYDFFMHETFCTGSMLFQLQYSERVCNYCDVRHATDWNRFCCRTSSLTSRVSSRHVLSVQRMCSSCHAINLPFPMLRAIEELRALAVAGKK